MFSLSQACSNNMEQDDELYTGVISFEFYMGLYFTNKFILPNIWKLLR